VVKIKIIQIVPTISYGDAVSNDVINIDNCLKKNGYDSYIYSTGIDKRLKDRVLLYKDLKKTHKDDVIIYHKAIGSDISFQLKSFKGTKVVRYHNITPKEYLVKYNRELGKAIDYGRDGLLALSNYADYSFAVSEYNAKELEDLNYKNINVLPILIPFEDYEKEPDKKTIEKYSDGKKNILFVGRIVPNKTQEDIIKSFYYYKKYVNKESRLILVGNDGGFENYSDLLKKLIKELELEKDVVFPGHISFAEILAFYRIADLFLCMSEHEGFGVPLVESMFFKVPILAYNSSAIKDTMGNSGVIVNKKDYFLISELMGMILSNNELKEEIIKKQTQRLEHFKLEKVEKKLLQLIEKIKEERNG